MNSENSFFHSKKAPLYLWIGIFSIWGFFLSGVANTVTSTPGVLQAFRIKSLLDRRELEQTNLEADLEHLEKDQEKLKSSSYAQEVEIRKNLGYVGEDEIVFDFSSAESTLEK